MTTSKVEMSALLGMVLLVVGLFFMALSLIGCNHDTTPEIKSDSPSDYGGTENEITQETADQNNETNETTAETETAETAKENESNLETEEEGSGYMNATYLVRAIRAF